MNSRAAVLAADSAVTVSHTDNEGNRVEKYHKGANKVFQLSENDPVGLMIYNAADIHSVPWEVIIKDYRKKNAHKSFSTLIEYPRDFIDYVTNNTALFSDQVRKQESRVYALTIGQIFHKQYVADKADSKIADGDDFLKFIANQASLDTVVEKKKAQFTDEEIASIKKDFAGDLCAHLKKVKALDMLSEEQHNLLADLLIDVSAGFYHYKQNFTGLVVTGYGQDEYFPTVKDYKCYGFVFGKLIFTEEKQETIRPDYPSHIQAYAMKDMVETFIQGINNQDIIELYNKMPLFLTDFALEVCKITGTSPTEQQVEAISKLVTSSRENMISEVANYFNDNHAKNIRRVIGYLPIDEISDLAETMIVLESLKEKVTRPSQSVGGPIDVAVISKSEGFVWIKRKHYFNSNLNPRFFKRNGYTSKHEVGENEKLVRTE